ncbi:Spy/CpxP family protein refolding chaperone [Horticoccus luteus]|uniref:Spy/CpxP family protein refolding chaperone n=1 Tax=Horticoccus luteus TaxID=2862869 RepID=A0A8F9TSZ0_9BACT|nr:Spy/CpxP family protein refolding chaperone [Horticoccus luteus]QYM78659.1 Spy/CpxP family protein refolding chaperone [Horticoccus luteus]
MKTSPKLMLLIAALGLAPMAPLVQAQDNPAPAPAADQDAHPARHARPDRLKMLTEKLDLTADQQAKVKAVLDDGAKQQKALHADENTPRAEKRDKALEIMLNTKKQIRALLTPDQQTKFDALREEHMEGRGRRMHHAN